MSMFTTLPPETWAEVFSIAAWIPFALDHSLSVHLLSGGDEQLRILYRRYYDGSLRLKAVISRVSKSWRALIIPLLYSDIRLSYDMRISVVDAILLDFAHRRAIGGEHGREESPRLVGWYTKRLDISWSYLQDNEAQTGLIQFLRTCHRLSIFIADGQLDCSPRQFSQICDNLVDKPLLRLRFTHYGPVPLQRLYLIPSLTTLHIPFLSSTPEVTAELPNVTSLALNMATDGQPTPLRFPALKWLSITNVAGSPMGIRIGQMNLLTPLLPFFEQNCKGVRALHLHFRFLRSFSEEQIRWNGLAPLLCNSPDVEEVIFDYEYLSGVVHELKKRLLAFPAVYRLGLVCESAPNLRFLEDIEDTFPHLRAIQFFHDFEKPPRMEGPGKLDIATRRGIVVEDWSGKRFN